MYGKQFTPILINVKLNILDQYFLIELKRDDEFISVYKKEEKDQLENFLLIGTAESSGSLFVKLNVAFDAISKYIEKYYSGV